MNNCQIKKLYAEKMVVIQYAMVNFLASFVSNDAVVLAMTDLTLSNHATTAIWFYASITANVSNNARDAILHTALYARILKVLMLQNPVMIIIAPLHGAWDVGFRF